MKKFLNREEKIYTVIPAQAGIHRIFKKPQINADEHGFFFVIYTSVFIRVHLWFLFRFMDSGLRRNDDVFSFSEVTA